MLRPCATLRPTCRSPSPPKTASKRLRLDVEQVLARRIQNRTKGWRQARQRFIEANLGLVVKIALRYENWTSVDLDDKIQEGNLGLMRAVDGFQPGRGKFSSYAGIIVENGIMRACREQSTSVRAPEHVHVGVARGTRESPPALQDVYQILDEEISEEEEIDEAEEARERMSAFRAHVKEMLCVLTDREALIVSQRLGLDGKKPRKQEIAERLKLTRGAISMAERAAIAKLLGALGGERAEPPHDGTHGSYAELFRMIEGF